MKIALIQSLIGGGGGNDMVFNSLLNHLSKTHNITVFTFSKPLTKPNYKYQTMMPIRIPLLGLYQSLLINIKKIDDFDLVISLSNLFIKTKKPVIFYNQNIFHDAKTNLDKYNSLFWRLYYKPFKIMLNNKLKNFKKNKNIHVINSSEFSKINMDETLKINSKVIYPPVRFSETKIVPKEPDTVVSLGRFSEEKNFELGINTLKLVGYKYRIIGSTNTISSKAYLKKLQDMANNNITFIINPTRDEIISELSKAKVFLGLSNETFGIATVEAISSGCIPIVRDTSGNKETVPFKELRFLTDLDMTEKIRNAMEGYYDVYLEKLHDHIQQFDESNFHKQIDDTIKEVMTQ